MEGGGGVHSKFMHILVHDVLLVQGNILVPCTFCLILFLGRIKGSQFTEPMSARIRDYIEFRYFFYRL